MEGSDFDNHSMQKETYEKGHLGWSAALNVKHQKQLMVDGME